MTSTDKLDRRTRKRIQSRQAILDAAKSITSTRGIEEATMAEIAELADVALGSLYNHFDSKDQLAIAVVDGEISDLALFIEAKTAEFSDPATVFGFGVRTVLEQATTNERWRHLLDTPGVMAERFFEGFGPYAIRDIEAAVDAGRFDVADPALGWRLATWAIIGFSSATRAGDVPADHVERAVVSILGIVGMARDGAEAVVASLAT